MAGAPYQFDHTISDDATAEFSLEWTREDGSGFPWSDYTFDYAIGQDGCQDRALSVGSGITVSTAQNLITFALGDPRLEPGRYQHGCRATHVATGKTVQMFDGHVTITEGGFR